jgi:1-acylglycerone phosphate reductase
LKFELLLIDMIGYLTPLLDADEALAKKLFDTNFWSVLRMVKAFSPSIIAAKGKVINTGAVTGVMTQPYWGSWQVLVVSNN